MATLIGPVLGNLGVIPLAAHLFIFYFGMVSMVTPLVALAALGVTCFAAGIAGQLRSPLPLGLRLAVFTAAGLLLAPGPTALVAGLPVPWFDAAGVVLLGAVWLLNGRSR